MLSIVSIAEKHNQKIYDKFDCPLHFVMRQSYSLLTHSKADKHLLQKLISAGWSLNAVDSQGNTLIHHIFERYSEYNPEKLEAIIDYLLNSGYYSLI